MAELKKARDAGVACADTPASTAPPVRLPTTSWTEDSQPQQQLALDAVASDGSAQHHLLLLAAIDSRAVHDTVDAAAACDSSTRCIEADLPQAAASEGRGRVGPMRVREYNTADDQLVQHTSDRASVAAEQFASHCLHKLKSRNHCDNAGGASSSDSRASAAQPPEEAASARSRASSATPLSAYCSSKLKQLRRQRHHSNRDKHGEARPSTATKSEHRSSQTKTAKGKAKSGVVQLPPEFKRKLNRMRIENLLHNLSEACKVQLHDPNRCRKCSKRLSEESRERFLQRHRKRLESALVASRYESHLARAAPVVAIGDIAAQLPRLGDPPAATWDRLMQTAKPPE